MDTDTDMDMQMYTVIVIVTGSIKNTGKCRCKDMYRCRVKDRDSWL
jgi:hypothetical protein